MKKQNEALNEFAQKKAKSKRREIENNNLAWERGGKANSLILTAYSDGTPLAILTYYYSLNPAIENGAFCYHILLETPTTGWIEGNNEKEAMEQVEKLVFEA